MNRIKPRTGYMVIATEKVQIKECKGCNDIDWRNRNTSSAYKRSIQECDDNGKELITQSMFSFCHEEPRA